MSCSNCQRVKIIPECSGVLTVGTIPDVSATRMVVFTNTLTGYEMYLQGTSDGDGLLTVDIEGDDFFSENFEYTLSVLNGETLNSYNDTLTITIDEQEYNCLLLTFKKVFNDDGQVEGAAEITLIPDL